MFPCSCTRLLDKSGNIDHAELVKYFSSGIGQNYKQIFATLEQLHGQMSEAIRKSYEFHSTNKDATELVSAQSRRCLSMHA